MKKILLGFIILLFSCGEKDNSNEFVGKWYDTEYRIPGRAYIDLKQDNTFYYKSVNCGWRTISKGKWTIENDTIELISVKTDSCYTMHPFVECLKFGDTSKTVRTILNCEPINNSASYAWFDRDQFYLRNDTLVFINRKKLECIDAVGIKFSKNKKK